jgi:hypothetical protein
VIPECGVVRNLCLFYCCLPAGIDCCQERWGTKVGTLSVEKLCESMQRMLAHLMEQAQAKSANASGGVSVALESNPAKLTGQ